MNFSIDKILVNYGFLTNQVTLAENLEVSRNGRVKADSMMQSNIEGLYVAGDASDYPGKILNLTTHLEGDILHLFFKIKSVF